MTELREAFPEIDDMDVVQLQAEHARLIRDANGDWKSLDDEALAKLLKITRAIRRKIPHSGKGRKPAAVKKEKKSTTLDDIA